MTLTETLYRTADQARDFIIPDAEPRLAGGLALRSLEGEEFHVDPLWAARFEVSEAEARGWAQEEFGFVLERLRHRLDTKLAQRRAALDRARAAPVTPDHAMAPDAVPAAFDLLCKLPRAILDAVSGDAARVTQAKDALTAIERRLGAAGVDVAPQLGAFPARLAGLRQEFEAARKPDEDKQNDSRV